MSLIAQLENLGHMAHWAVYVALHIPDHPAQEWHLLREHVVQELLRRHAPIWASDSSTQDFLLHKLHVPAAWLDQALAQWASYCHDDSGEKQGSFLSGSAQSFCMCCKAGSICQAFCGRTMCPTIG